jgi:uncharacterized protein YigE (DUF2233 family)
MDDVWAKWLIALLLCLLAGCGPAQSAEAPSIETGPPPTLMPTPTGSPPPSPPLLQPTAPPADTGWLVAADGVELRRLQVSVNGQAEPVSVTRLDPALLRFEVGYAPDAPLPLSAWLRDSGALVAINGSFFDADGRSVALLVRDGQPFGESYSGRGGMFAVTPEGALWLRGLAAAPFTPGEPVAEGLQGWPMLVSAPGEAAYSFEDGARDRRSAIALDESGRVLLIVAPTAAFTLRELSVWLATADLGVATAMNLDGGSSTGLIVQSESAGERIDPFAPLPIVLLALRR